MSTVAISVNLPAGGPRGLSRLEEPRSAFALFVAVAAVRLGSAYSAVADYVFVGLVLAIAVVSLRAPRRGEWGMCRPRSWSLTGMAMALLISLYLAEAYVLLWALDDPQANWILAFHALMKQSFPIAETRWFLVVSSASLVFYAMEEFYFRGLLFRAFLVRLSPAAAVLITSVIWALLHLGSYGLNPFHGGQILGMLPCVFLMGVFLGGVRLATGSAVACFLCQAAGNVALNVWTVHTFGR